MPASNANRIPGYNLDAPNEADVVASLVRVFGDERGAALWRRTCTVAGIWEGRVSATEDLERALRALAAEGGAAATVARSIEIRLRTHARLRARAGQEGARA